MTSGHTMRGGMLKPGAWNDLRGAISRVAPRLMLGIGPIAAALLSIHLLRSTGDMTDDFWNVRMWPWYLNDPTSVATNEYFLRGILFSAVLLIIWNTFVYGIYSFQRSNGVVHTLNFFMIVIAFYWLYHVYTGAFNPFVDDGAALTLFSLFFTADLLMWLHLRGEIKTWRPSGAHGSQAPPAAADPISVGKVEHTRRAAVAEQQTYFLQMTVVDAPVIFGILYALYLASHVFSPSVVSQVDTGAKAFDIGFRLGTLAMHLAISQFIFVG